MKKGYFKPEMKVVKLKARQSLLAGSVGGDTYNVKIDDAQDMDNGYFD